MSCYSSIAECVLLLQSKRMAKEKRIMNWEKLFSKMTSVRGHSRRWKFLIDTIKEKAKLGLEHVQVINKYFKIGFKQYLLF